jgi:hypothetical protein
MGKMLRGRHFLTQHATMMWLAATAPEFVALTLYVCNAMQ